MLVPRLSTDKVPKANGVPIDWASMLEQHRGWLRTVVATRVKDSHVADEVLQEVALAVLKQKSGPSDPAKVAPWLYRVAVRHVINYHRKTGRQRRMLQVFAGSGLAADATEPTRDWLIADEAQESVKQALEQLSLHDRQILLLKYTEGWTYKNLAQHLGVKEKTIEHRLVKARRALRCRLRRCGFEKR